MKKIVILIKEFKKAGTEVALLSLLNKIDYKKYNVTILCLFSRGELLSQIPKEIKVKEIKFKKSWYSISSSVEKENISNITQIVGKIIRKYYRFKYRNNYYEIYNNLLNKVYETEEKYDVLLDFYGYGSFLTAYGGIKINAAKKATWLHDEKQHWLKRTMSYLKYYDKIYCVSNAVKNQFEKNSVENIHKLEVLYNFTDTELIQRKSSDIIYDDLFNGDYKILSVGRLCKQKGFDLAIEVANLLKIRGIKFKWFIIGEGSERKGLEIKIKEYKLEEDFILLGYRENPYPYMKMCDLYVQPSRYEGYCTTIVEAQVVGAIILATNIPSFNEQIKNGRNGFIANFDKYDMSKRIEEIIRDYNSINLDEVKVDFSNEVKKLTKFIGE